MNNSVMKVFGSSTLALAFILAPVAPAFDTPSIIKFAKVEVAEAAPISYGTISGIVSDPKNSQKGLKDITVNLYLKKSNSLHSSLKTDENGIFAFSVPQEQDYKVEVSIENGYAILKGAVTSVEIPSLRNSYSAIRFEVVKLPYIKMFGGSEITISKGTKFEDPGVIFQKDDGTVVTGYAIESNGSVDVNKVGKYTISYSIDKAATNGYAIKEAIRTINVVDKNIGLTVVIPNQIVSKLTTNNSCVYLNSYLGKSFVNDKLEVLKLQAFLAFKEGNRNVRATGVFDNATEVAVRNFQDKHYKEILMPWGTEDNTGEVRMLTLKKINDLQCGRSIGLTLAQEQTLTAYKNSVLYPKIAVDIKEVPLVLPESKSIGAKVSSWWKSVKKSLVAAFPTISDDKDDKVAENSTGTPVAKVEKKAISASGTDIVATAKEAKQGKFSVLATIISAILGLAAFVLAFYIYKKTRGPAVIEIIPAEEPKVNVKVTK